MIIFADTGLPMISVFLPAAWLMLIPIILIEAFIGLKVAKLTFRQTVYGATVGNLFSTLLGIPITWSVLAGIEGQWFGTAMGLDSFAAKLYAVTLQAPWLTPYEDDLAWMVPAAVVFLAIVFWLMSVVSEYLILRIVLRIVKPAALWRWMWIANTASYVLLLSFIFLLAILGPVASWIFHFFQPVTDLIIH